MSDWKPAKKAFTKTQKSQRSTIREEYDWTIRLPKTHPHMIEAFGQWHWLIKLMELNNFYKEASDNRDELFNNHMLLLAATRPELLEKLTNHEELTPEEKDKAKLFLEAAVKESKV